MEQDVKSEKKTEKVVTKAMKARRQKDILKRLLKKREYKWNELLDDAVKEYQKKYGGEETEIPDLKGKFGSNFSLLEEGGEVVFDKATNTCSLVKKTGKTQKASEQTTSAVKQTATAVKQTATAVKQTASAVATTEAEQKTDDKKEQAKKAAIEKAVQKAQEKAAEKQAANVAEQVAEKAATEKPTAEKTAEPKRRGRKPAAKEVKAGVTAAQTETIEKTEKKAIEKTIEKPQMEQKPQTAQIVQPVQPVQKPAATPTSAKTPVKKEVKNDFLTDFVFLGNAAKQEAKSGNENKVQNTQPQTEEKAQNAQPQAEKKTQSAQTAQNGQNAQNTAVQRTPRPVRTTRTQNAQNAQNAQAKRTLTADEKLKEEFLKRLRALSGEYFEYYSVYLLERYSLKSGRRLEGLKVSGGKHDGGIDGEIELTDRFGFRETIYIQAKNWDPTKGAAEKWTIGETLIQQFVGAATCRQMKDSKRNCRGIFVTTSTYTKEAKEALEVLGEKFIGYDGDDVYETAKECRFGLVQENGVWKLDEKLLSGDSAFFQLF